ncbi:MAG: cyclic nucleotide-binding domain-containing protein [Candidatus Dormibacteria bacterium]
MNTIADLIAEHSFFSGLERADLEFVAGCGRNVRFTTGERILSEGDPANAFYVLRTGRVALGFLEPGSGNVIVDTLDGGEVLGWSWLFEPYVWHFDADAVEPVSAVAFDAVCLRTKCESDPRLGYRLTQEFARVMLDRLQSARLRMLDMYGAVHAR